MGARSIFLPSAPRDLIWVTYNLVVADVEFFEVVQLPNGGGQRCEPISSYKTS